MPRNLKFPNKYTIIKGSPIAALTIYNRKGEGIDFLVDLDVVDDLRQYNWSLSRRSDGLYYSYHKINGVNEFLHAYIAKTPKGLTTDHISGDTRDTRRENLRIATRAQNGQNRRRASNNTSGMIGVSYNKRNRNYVAKITVNKQRIHIGVFADAASAGLARDLVAMSSVGHGSFSNLNYPQLRRLQQEAEAA